MFSSNQPDILKPKKAPQQIITKIRSAILTEKLTEGERLPTEPELMRHFGVSRQTIREALCALESMGLLTVRAGLHGGAYVRTVDAGTAQAGLSNFLFGKDFSINNITEVRLALEPYAARVAAVQMNDAAKKDLRALVVKCREAIARQEDIGKLRRSEVAFHELIMAATENPILMLLHQFSEHLLWNVKTKLKTQSEFSLQVLAAHEKILAAIEESDADKAEQYMRDDILQVEQSLVRIADEQIRISLLEPEGMPAV